VLEASRHRLSESPVSRRLFVRRRGHSGPVVVLLHGLGASGRFWRPVAERLATGARVVCPDLLGFGRSPWPSVAYNVADHLAALDHARDGLDLDGEPAILAGHSVGAILALEWAAARPERFAGVLLVSLPAYRSAVEARERIAALSPLAWATVARPDLGELICGLMCAWRPFWRAVIPVMMPRLPPDVARDGVLHNWVSYSGTLRNVVVEHRVGPAAERLAEARVPVRLLHGNRDEEAPVAATRELADRLGWPLTVLKGCTHRLPLEAPAACADVLGSLLRGPRVPP
jgi:pimeloyl-ACP methyl ester carboxylesterase